LKAGIQLADILTTVSRNYAREIQESSEQGLGYEGLLRYRSHDLHGIPNRIDYDLWNPATDSALAHRYSLEDAPAGKAINKIALQPVIGLPADASLKMLGVASRLSYHKGIDMIADALPEFVELGLQLAIVGNAEPEDLERLMRLKERFGRHLGLHAEFSETMARKIFAASDFFLMPSRMEPCGISQMIAQRYGSRPIVAPTGGLLETVKDAQVFEDGDGFFMREISTRGLVAAVKAALAHPDPARLQRNGMTRDNSWGPSVVEYEALFRRLIGG
jgi:starch synthase